MNTQPTIRTKSKVHMTILIGGLLIAGFVILHFSSHGMTGLALAAGKPVYTCPMDPQIRQDTPGKCSICGMNLVLEEPKADTSKVTPESKPKEATKAVSTSTQKSASGKYQCPMHPTIVKDGPGDCPICGMKLVKMKDSGGTAPSAAPVSKKIIFYRSPMDPKQTSPTPRKDEMGMDYIPVYEGDGSTSETVKNRAEVEIDPQRQQLIGLRTAVATQQDISTDWTTVGRVQADPTRVRKTNVKIAGFVEQVFADFVGRSVQRGEPLFTYYSPELVAAQQEYLLALKIHSSHAGDNASSDDSTTIEAVRQKLRFWDVPESELDRIAATGAIIKAITFQAPFSGVITAKNIVEGSAMNPGDAAYEITNLNSVWIVADAYQSDATRAKLGTPATVRVESIPDREFKGSVAFIDAVLDPQTRTFKIRVDLDNSDGILKPEMFAEVQFQSGAHQALTIPADAIIPTGRGSMVFIAAGNGKFQPRAVTTGQKSGDQIEIITGMQAGESVVTRANFLVDSESSLRAALAAFGG